MNTIKNRLEFQIKKTDKDFNFVQTTKRHLWISRKRYRIPQF